MDLVEKYVFLKFCKNCNVSSNILNQKQVNKKLVNSFIYHKLERNWGVFKCCLRCELGFFRSKHVPFLPIRSLHIDLVPMRNAGSKVVILLKCEEMLFTRTEDT